MTKLTAACSVLPIAGPASSFRLLPAGLFRASDGRPGGIAGWYLDRNIAGVLISLAATQANDFVIDYEHQSLQANSSGQPAPAAG